MSFIILLGFFYKQNVIPYISCVRVVQMLQNIQYKETPKTLKEIVGNQRHNNPSLLKRVLRDFSLVICMDYY